MIRGTGVWIWLAMKFTAWCVGNFRTYVVFSKSILFILGLIFSYKLVEKVFFDILITHLPDERDSNQDLRRAAIVVNLQEGICAVMQILFAFLADAYLGLFKMVVCSTSLCIIGLLLICIAAWNGDGFLNVRVFYPALVLMTLSQAGELTALNSFLEDQMVARDRPATPEERERARKRSNFWWNSVSFLATILALFGPLTTYSFVKLAKVLAVAMGAAFLLFLLGIKLYERVEPTGSPLSDVVHVIRSAIMKRDVEYPETPEQLLENSSGLVQISPHVSWLRWLDRAAVVQESPAGHTCTVEQVKGVKLLLKMLPLWTTFLSFSLVAASGSTFFLEEATSITHRTFPILFFTNLRSFTGFIVSMVTDSVLEKLGKKMNINAQRMMLVRIGTGMICSVLCCIAAWANASPASRVSHMSVYWLTPQYLLLAFMEGLSQEGLENFFNSQVSQSMSKYGMPFGECVMGVGKFLSVVCILILSRWLKWFQDEPQPRRLDKYYAMLAILSSVNFVVYCFVARCYGDDTFASEEEEVDIEMGDHVVQLDSLAPLLSRSLSRKASYKSNRSSSGSIASIPEERESGFGDDLTENTDFEQTRKHGDSSSLPLLKLETGQEIASSSSTAFHDHETTVDGRSDASLRSAARSFSRLSSRGAYRRFHSMR